MPIANAGTADRDLTVAGEGAPWGGLGDRHQLASLAPGQRPSDSEAVPTILLELWL